MDTIITSYRPNAAEKKVTITTSNQKIKLKHIPFPIIQTIQKGDAEYWDYTIIFDANDIPKEYTDDNLLSEIGMTRYYSGPGGDYADIGFARRINGKVICQQTGGLDT